MTEHRHHDRPTEPLHELVEDAAERNPDTTTRREALELDLVEEGRSDEGERVGKHLD
jgi:hypothetical protein